MAKDVTHRSAARALAAADFFEHQLPRLFGEAGARPDRSGSVVFEVGGESGGRWAIDLRKPPEVRAVDPDVHGDLLVRIGGDAFGRFVDGTLDVATAIQEGDLLFAGDLTLLDALAEMWRPPLDPLALRVREARR